MRAPAVLVINRNGKSVTWRLCQADVPGDYRRIYLSGKMLTHFLGDLRREIGSPVEHGQ